MDDLIRYGLPAAHCSCSRCRRVIVQTTSGPFVDWRLLGGSVVQDCCRAALSQLFERDLQTQLCELERGGA